MSYLTIEGLEQKISCGWALSALYPPSADVGIAALVELNRAKGHGCRTDTDLW
jgi:hypothetical protein